MILELDVALRRGDFSLSACFQTTSGITALFGPSGSGKTTLTQIVAGLLAPDHGRIVLNGDILLDTERRRSVPTHRRRIAVVFQDGRLLPHCTVRQNLLYGAWFNRVPTPPLDQIVQLLGIEHCLGRRPLTLSGGEQRRVAIGRALLAAPRLLILDEPMNGLDAARKEEIMPYLEQLRDEAAVPILFISHALDEIVRLADDLVLFEEGQVIASGPLSQVLSRVSTGVARNEAGVVIETVVAAIDGQAQLATLNFADGRLAVPAAGLALRQCVRLHVRARDVAIATAAPVGLSMQNVLAARIAAIEPHADGTAEIHLAIGGTALVSRITSTSMATLGLAADQPVFALIKSLAFDRAVGQTVV